MHAAASVPRPVVPRLAAVRHLIRARQAFQALETWLMREESRQLPWQAVEREQEHRGREIPRLVLQAHVAQRGTGEVGPAVEVGATDSLGEEARHAHRRLDPRHPQPIFGESTSERLGYCRAGTIPVHRLDDQLPLPSRSFADALQRRLVQATVQGPFDEATARVAEATGVVIPKRRAEDLVQEAARHFEAFSQPRLPPPEAETGPILVAALDGTGGPMVKAAPARRAVRRAKGEHAHQKKMAVVATVYTQQPRLRTPQEVFEHLFGLGPGHPLEPAPGSPPRERPEYKRVGASLLKGQAGIMAAVVQELQRRDPVGQKPWGVLTEGERALPHSVTRRLRGVPLILDFPHALAKLWTAASAFHAEGSPKALAWVQERAWRWLHGAVQPGGAGDAAECHETRSPGAEAPGRGGRGGVLLPESRSEARCGGSRPGLADRHGRSGRGL
jgi:hypothetical protein